MGFKIKQEVLKPSTAGTEHPLPPIEVNGNSVSDTISLCQDGSRITFDLDMLGQFLEILRHKEDLIELGKPYVPDPSLPVIVVGGSSPYDGIGGRKK